MASIILIFVAVVLQAEYVGTSLTFVGAEVVVFVSHVLFGLICGFEAGGAGVAFVGPDPVGKGIHVLFACLASGEATSAFIALERRHAGVENARRVPRSVNNRLSQVA